MSAGTQAFPITVTHGEETGQIVVSSGGNVHALERVTKSVQNPLASGPSHTPQAHTLPQERSQGFVDYSIDIPEGWSVSSREPNKLVLDTGTPKAFAMLLRSTPTAEILATPREDLMKVNIASIAEFVRQGRNIPSDPSGARIRSLQIGTSRAHTTHWTGSLEQANGSDRLHDPVGRQPRTRGHRRHHGRRVSHQPGSALPAHASTVIRLPRDRVRRVRTEQRLFALLGHLRERRVQCGRLELEPRK